MKIGKHLRARGSAHRSTLSAVSLLLLGAGGILLPVGEAKATYCDSNLQYSLSGVPDGEINLAGKKNGDHLFTATFTHISGVCRPPIPQNGMALYGSLITPANSSCANSGRAWDRKGILEVGCEARRFHIAYKAAPVPNPMVVPGHGQAFFLKNKQAFIGKTTISMGEFYLGSPTSWSQNIQQWQYQTEPTISLVGDINKTITLVYTPTCSASVDDVVFPGTPTASAIAAGTVTPRTATVNVSCDDILPKYTIRVSSPNGTQGNATDGVIKSDNPTVGYRLSWKEGQVASTGSNIQLDSALTPTTQPTTNTFTLPISVKPVALVPQANVTAGPANSAIKIDLTFN